MLLAIRYDMARLKYLDERIMKQKQDPEAIKLYKDSISLFPGIRHSVSEEIGDFLNYKRNLEEFIELDIGNAFNITVDEFLNRSMYSINIMKEVARERLKRKITEQEKMEKMMEI